MGEGTDEQMVFLPDLLVRLEIFLLFVVLLDGMCVVRVPECLASRGDQSPLH